MSNSTVTMEHVNDIIDREYLIALTGLGSKRKKLVFHPMDNDYRIYVGSNLVRCEPDADKVLEVYNDL